MFQTHYNHAVPMPMCVDQLIAALVFCGLVDRQETEGTRIAEFIASQIQTQTVIHINENADLHQIN